jgi:hypothetical protein
LGYDLAIPGSYFERRLAKHFALADPVPLRETWATASGIVPLVNRFFFRVNDFQFSPEACLDRDGFLSLDQFFQHPPLIGSGILSVQDYARAVLKDEPFDGITPMEVADELDERAETSLRGAEALQADGQSNIDLAATLIDIRALAHLGRYYADKIRGAAQLAVYRADKSQTEYKQRAVRYLTDAVQDWEAYSEVASSAYRRQLFSRTNYLDWQKILGDVKGEVQAVRAE